MSLPLATIDFETRSILKIDVGAYRYAHHPSTYPLCMAYNLTGEPETESFSEFLIKINFDQALMDLHDLHVLMESYNDCHKTQLWVPKMFFPHDLFYHIREGGLVEAHNSFFEHCIWNQIMVKQFDWPTMPLNQWRCSMAKARAAGYPGSLDNLGKALDLPIQKDKRGKYLIKTLCKPRLKTVKHPEERWREDIDLITEMVSYCGRDVDTEMMASQALPEMTKSELEIWQFDQRLNWHGIPIDVDSVEKIVRVLTEIKGVMNGRISGITNGAATTANQRAKILAWCKEQGYPLAAYDEKAVTTAVKDKGCPDNVRSLLQIRQMLSLSSTAKFEKMLAQQVNGRIHNVLMYHKAHTGRWGGVGVQFQNLPRYGADFNPEFSLLYLTTATAKGLIELYENPFDVAKQCVRATVCAAPGKEFICADFASIEARMLLWAANDQRATQLFRDGKDIYKDMASQIFRVHYDTITKSQRFVGKQAVLGLGYQMGAPKFYSQNIDIIPDLTIGYSELIVYTYRETYSKVKGLWYNLENAAHNAVINKGIQFNVNLIKFKMIGNDLVCCLPSGRWLRYPKASLKMKMAHWGEEKLSLHYWTHSVIGGWREETTYGGSLLENIIQGMARDVMAEAALRLEKAGYPCVLLVHDEYLAEVEIGAGDLKEFESIMAQNPTWAKSLPIAVDGWRGKRFRK